MRSKLKIIGGQFRGKTFTFPSIKSIRPTTNMVRETLFNWLMGNIHNTTCLDLFAGSGALGLEAYSRGAQKIIFIEQEYLIYKNLCNTIENFNTSMQEVSTNSTTKLLNIYNKDALSYLKTSTQKFNIIFLDPPFNTDLLTQCLELILSRNILETNGFIYFESGVNIDYILPAKFNDLELYRYKKTGNVYYGLLRKKLS